MGADTVFGMIFVGYMTRTEIAICTDLSEEIHPDTVKSLIVLSEM